MYMRGTVRMAFYTEGLGDSKAEDDPRFGYIKGLGFRVKMRLQDAPRRAALAWLKVCTNTFPGAPGRFKIQDQ